MPSILNQRRACVVVLAATAALVSGCGGSVTENVGAPPLHNHGCVEDSKACIDQRQAALRTLQSDASRGWVRQPATVNAYATGVRMFAFKTEKTRLTCDELGIGRREADNAPGILRSPQATGLSPAVVSRSIMFASEVSHDIVREQQRRCRT